jgi:hypothetical protein
LYDLLRPKVPGNKFGIAPFRSGSNPDPNSGVVAQISRWCDIARASEKKLLDEPTSPKVADKERSQTPRTISTTRDPRTNLADVPQTSPRRELRRSSRIKRNDHVEPELTQAELTILSEEMASDETFDIYSLCARFGVELADVVQSSTVKCAIDIANECETSHGRAHNFKRSLRIVAESVVKFARPSTPPRATEDLAVRSNVGAVEDGVVKNASDNQDISDDGDVEVDNGTVPSHIPTASAHRIARLIGTTQLHLSDLMRSLSALQAEILSDV